MSANTYKHLGQLGLEQLLQLMATEFGKVQYEEAGKGLSTNDFTNALLEKLNGIEAGANKYVHATHDAATSGLYKITVDTEGHVTAVTAVAKEDITGLGIPGQDTTYVIATQTADGLMAAADKKKLDGIEEGANKYVHATHGAYAAGIYKITVDAEGHVTAASAVTKAELATIIGEATQSESGLMSAADKKAVDELGSIAKLNEIGETNLSEALKKKIDAASTAQHTHSNKDLLDTYTQTETDLADAVSKKHDHANKAELDKIAVCDKAKWDAAEQNAKDYADGKVKDLADGQVTTNKGNIETLMGDETTAGSVKKAVKDLADGQVATNKNAIATLNGSETTEGSVRKTVKDYCDAKISSTYKAAGSVTYETLPEASAANEGYVYNISNDFTTDEDFIEGAGHKYKAGTNVVVVEVDGAYKYDVLAMSFDGFVQEANISEYTAQEVIDMWNSVFTA